MFMQRTTLSLEDEVLALLRKYAAARAITLGQAVGDLVRRGLDASHGVRETGGLYVVNLPTASPVVRSVDVKRLDADEP